MLKQRHIPAASWSLLDQGVVSLGTFLLNVILARFISPYEYGLFAILFSVIFLLQTVSSSLVFYPLSVRAGSADPEDQESLIASGVLLSICLALPLGILLVSVTLIFVDSNLSLLAFTLYLATNFQETLRRCLFAQFRHREAIVGDSVSYLGQVVIIAALAQQHELTLATALLVMIATSLGAALVQILQKTVMWPSAFRLRSVVNDFWNLGKWSLTSNVAAMLRLQMIPWFLAATAGPSVAASFQAALNIINVNNPIIAGLCNVIPQTAARAADKGYWEAWRAVSPLFYVGLALTVMIFIALNIMPARILRFVYGEEAFYIQIVGAVQILAVSSLFNYFAIVGCSYLYGVKQSYKVHKGELTGTIIAIFLAFIVVPKYGLIGSCLVLAISNLIRSGIAGWQIKDLLRQLRMGRTEREALKETGARSEREQTVSENLKPVG